MGKAKVNIPMCVALVLLLLTMISIHLTSGLYARYTATSTGSDSARVAKWDVKGSSATTDLSIQNIPDNDSGTYTFTVTNNSEVAMEYTIDLSFKSDVPEWVQLTLDETDPADDVEGTLTNSTTCTFEKTFTLAPGANATHNVLMSANWTKLTATETAETIERNLAFTVNIHAQQID